MYQTESSSSLSSSSGVSSTSMDIPMMQNKVMKSGEKILIRVPKRNSVRGAGRVEIKENETTTQLKRVIEEEVSAKISSLDQHESYIRDILQRNIHEKGEGHSLEDLRKKIADEILRIQTDGDIGKHVLDHLGDYVEEPYTLIESYFEAQHLERLVRHQIESYNHFINYSCL